MTYQDSFHWSSAVPKRFKRNITEELGQATRTSSDIEMGNDRIFKKYLNATKNLCLFSTQCF